MNRTNTPFGHAGTLKGPPTPQAIGIMRTPEQHGHQQPWDPLDRQAGKPALSLRRPQPEILVAAGDCCRHPADTRCETPRCNSPWWVTTTVALVVREASPWASARR